MSWGNGDVTITFVANKNVFRIDMSDPDGVSRFVVREVDGRTTRTVGSGDGKCSKDVTHKIPSSEISQQNKLYDDCDWGNCGDWLLDPTHAASRPNMPISGDRQPRGTSLNREDDDGDGERHKEVEQKRGKE